MKNIDRTHIGCPFMNNLQRIFTFTYKNIWYSNKFLITIEAVLHTIVPLILFMIVVW